VLQSTDTPVTKTLLSTEEAEVGLMLSELMEALEAIDVNDPKAKLNKTSISDNNGGRILL
jgi:hypothetical protein